MDLDIDMGDAYDVGHELPQAEIPTGDDILQTDEAEEPGEVIDDEPAKDDNRESSTLAPTKIHVRGVDTLHTDEIKAYVRSHYGPVDKVEWIDDTSANLVFSSEATARDALVALSAIDIADPTALGIGETLTAKPVADRSEISLQVRFAVLSDKKEAGAAMRSRYYLLHPEHDPEERRRRSQDNRSRYRDREGDHRRSTGGGRGRRRDSDEAEPFDASMYDDAPAPATRRRLSDSEDRPRSYARENRGKELFAGRASGRDRSASPMRDEDGDQVIGDGAPASSSRNRTSARSLKDRISTDNKAKELFPTKASSSKGGQLDQLEDAIGSARLKEEDRPKVVDVPGGSFNIRGLARQRSGGDTGFSIKGSAASAKELFPDRFGGGGGGGGGNTGKELFDSGRSKPRQRAEDLFS